MGSLVICLDISESMAYGEPCKINQAFNLIKKIIQSLSRDTHTGLVTFDVTSEVSFDLQPLDKESIATELGKIVPRGVSCIAAGLTDAINLVEKNGKSGEIILLSDGRANLSKNQLGGFEGSIDLEKELFIISKDASRHVIINSVAVGEDAFTGTLSEIARIANGCFWLAEDYPRLRVEVIQSTNTIKRYKLSVHSLPIELPSAQPTWIKESQFMHVAVVSQNLYDTYLRHRKTILYNLNKNREARTALMSIMSNELTGYRERNPKIARYVDAEEAILLDKSYRNYLDLSKGTSIELFIN